MKPVAPAPLPREDRTEPLVLVHGLTRKAKPSAPCPLCERHYAPACGRRRSNEPYTLFTLAAPYQNTAGNPRRLNRLLLTNPALEAFETKHSLPNEEIPKAYGQPGRRTRPW
jgi:hypothetical protein